MHCEGIMSGELKHGPLAMVDEKLCTFMIICSDHVYKVRFPTVSFRFGSNAPRF